MKRLLIMKHIDFFTFDLVGKFKGMPSHQKIVDEYGVLEEWQQGIVKFVLMLATICIPLLFLFASFLFYSSRASDLERFETYIEDSSIILNQTAQLKEKSLTVFGQPISTEGQLSSRINTILGAVGIEASNVKVNDINIDNQSGTNNITASLEFQDFTDQNFFTFMRRMLFIENFKIKNIHIEKIKENNLLKGKLGIAYYSRVQESDDE
jgi:hypothetical protein